MKTNKILLLITCLLSSCAQLATQDDTTDNGCGIHGSANPNRPEYELNVLKNRSVFPTENDFQYGIALSQLINSSNESDFNVHKAVKLKGYVYNVKMGGVETCNCKTTDESIRDTHIELTPDAEHTGAEYRIIVEVTPRMRHIMSGKGIDWSTETLKSTLISHTVEITGWLFYDEEHKSQAFATNPGGERNWRASCWELHPITEIKIKSTL